jgi:hypothetical protein
MAFLIVFLVLGAVACLGAWLGADTRRMDPRDDSPQWPFAPYRH